MRLTQLTSPTTLPVTLRSVKLHLAIEQDEGAWDDLLTEQIWAACSYVQQRTRLQLINTQFMAAWPTFPCSKLKLPLFPIVTVDEVLYIDGDGDEQTVADYQSELVQCPAYIMPEPNEVWPSTKTGITNGLQVTFTAGHGTTAETVPHEIRHCVRMLVGHWFRNREAVVTGSITKEIEFSVEALCRLVRVNEFEYMEVQR